MKTLSMRGKTNHDFDLIIAGADRGSERPLSASRNDSYIEIPGRDGTILKSGSLQNNTLRVNFIRYNKGRNDWFDVRNDIVGWLHSKDEVKIRVDDEPGVYYLGKVSTYDVPIQHTSIVELSVEFTVQPFRFADSRNIIINPGDSGQFELYNKGNYDAPYKATITVAGAGSTFDFTINGRRLRYSGAVGNGDVITIDSAGHEFRLNDELKVIQLSGSFNPLSAGKNNVEVSVSSRLEFDLQELFV